MSGAWLKGVSTAPIEELVLRTIQKYMADARPVLEKMTSDMGMEGEQKDDAQVELLNYAVARLGDIATAVAYAKGENILKREIRRMH